MRQGQRISSQRTTKAGTEASLSYLAILSKSLTRLSRVRHIRYISFHWCFIPAIDELFACCQASQVPTVRECRKFWKNLRTTENGIIHVFSNSFWSVLAVPHDVFLPSICTNIVAALAYQAWSDCFLQTASDKNSSRSSTVCLLVSSISLPWLTIDTDTSQAFTSIFVKSRNDFLSVSTLFYSLNFTVCELEE